MSELGSIACTECGCEANSYHHAGCPHAPYVCPGCHAVGGERCAPGCIDAEMARDREEAIDRGDYDDSDEEEDEP